jgi:transcriptional regulator with XRE-family HTH domain
MAIYISPINQFVIDKVTEFRIKNNITQEVLGAMIGKTRSFISNVERGNHQAKYNLRHLAAISFYYNVPVHSFLPEKAMPEEEILKKSQAQVIKKGDAQKAK